MVEDILNGRPLTTTSDDPEDLTPLTPNHLLLMKDNSPLPPDIFQESDLYVRRRWRQVQYLSDIFWKRWSKEYLHTLQTRQKWTKPMRDAKCGDIVLVMEENLPRNQWCLGRIQEVVHSTDGHVRRVSLKVKNGIMERPIGKTITLLEAENDD